MRTSQQIKNDKRLASGLVSVFVIMLVVSFASAKLYEMFCKATGYGGTTQVAKVSSTTLGSRSIKVRFDANVAPGLPWKFEAETPEIEVKLGETVEVYYTIRNTSSQPATGIATYNVQPDMMGGFFNKIACFCFTEQTLKPGESRKETVVFFVDPAMEKDKNTNLIQTMTLSYTFSAVKSPNKSLAELGKSTEFD
jgi:cytochrome c oxidase assembly protein subunit 11